MINTFLILKTIYNEEIRLSVDEICGYKTEAHYVSLTCKNGMTHQLLGSVEHIDQILSECYMMIKKVDYV